VFTWHQITFEVAMFLTGMIVFACVIILSRQSFHVIYRRRRFSLRDLLVVFTLVAAIAGLMIGTSKENNEGIPRKKSPNLFASIKQITPSNSPQPAPAI
jgi:hypothetical protein